MDTIKIKKGNVKMIAHRGVSGLEKENTMSAFVAAGNRSYWGIETDVHRTCDGKYVIIHDDMTGAVADRNICVEKSSFDEIEKIRLKDIDDELSRRDLIIPTLDEYIRVCKKYEKIAVLELKNRFAQEHIGDIVEIIKGIGYLDKTVFISFDFDNLVDLRKICPENEIHFLVKEYCDELIDRLKENSFELDIKYVALNSENIAKIKKEGIKINCWTVNDSIYGEQLADWGVDYITTNILE